MLGDAVGQIAAIEKLGRGVCGIAPRSVSTFVPPIGVDRLTSGDCFCKSTVDLITTVGACAWREEDVEWMSRFVGGAIAGANACARPE